MRIALLLLLVSLNAWSATNRTDWETVKICHLAWGKSTGANLHHKGVYLHLMEEVFKNAGYPVETYVLPWKRCLQHTQYEVIDMVASAWLTPENTKNMLLKPMILSGYMAKNYLITTKTDITDSKPATLEGLRFGSPAINSLPDFIREQYIPVFARAHFQATQVNSIKMLLKGRIDLVYSPLDTFLDVYNELPIEDRPPYKILQPSFNGIPVGPLLPKNSAKPQRQQKLIEDFNRSYQELCINGKLLELLIEHSAEDGLLTHLQDSKLPDIITHCTLLLEHQTPDTTPTTQQLLELSGHLAKPSIE